MKTISLDFNSLTKIYFMADSPNIFVRQICVGNKLETIVNNIGMMMNEDTKKKIKLRVYPEFSEEDLNHIKDLLYLRGYKKIIYERYNSKKIIRVNFK